MKLRSLCCLPRVELNIDNAELLGSSILHIPFSEWLILEGQSRSAPYHKLRLKYERNPPLFWEKEIQVDDRLILEPLANNTLEINQLIQPAIESFINSLHWYCGTAPILPSTSVTYFDPRHDPAFANNSDLQSRIKEVGVRRLYGESEKEYATQNINPIIILESSDIEPLKKMQSFVEATSQTWSQEQFQSASQTLRLMSLPGLDWQSRIVLWVGSYEVLIIPDIRQQLQATFSKRLACIASNRFEDIPQLTASFKFFYQVRSNLVHGRPAYYKIKKTPQIPERYVHSLSQLGIVVLYRLIDYLSRHDSQYFQALYNALDSASDNNTSYQQLQLMLKRVNLQGNIHQFETDEYNVDIPNTKA